MAQLVLVQMAWGCASRALDPEQGTGDRALVVKCETGILFAVVDGLGHGPLAAEAAQSATAALEEFAEPDLRRMVSSCHERMKGTRGATMGVAWMDLTTSLLTWLGIGNVVGILHRGPFDPTGPPLMPQYGGIVGRRISIGRPAQVRVGVQDTIVLATDGVDRGLANDLPGVTGTEEQFADRMIAAHANGQDDALVLVARRVASQS